MRKSLSGMTAVGLLSAILTTAAGGAPVLGGGPFDDYIANGESGQQNGLPGPEATSTGEVSVSPKTTAQIRRPGLVTTLNSSGRAVQVMVEKLPVYDAGTPRTVSPKRAAGWSEKPLTSSGGTDASTANFQLYCNYAPGFEYSPAPPATGGLYNVARGLNGVPYSRAGTAKGVWTGTQGYVSQSGFTPATVSRSAYAQSVIQMYLAGFPRGSSVYLLYNPVFRGRGSTQSTTSLLQSQSTGAVNVKIHSAVGPASSLSWSEIFDFGETNSSGVAKTTPTWFYNGAPNSGYFYQGMPIAGDSNYKFLVRSLTTVTATSVSLGAAAADLDFGSAIISTPAQLSPYNFAVKPNANGTTLAPYGHLTILYVLPAGWGMSC